MIHAFKYKNETGNNREFDILENELYQLNKEKFLDKIKNKSGTQILSELNLKKRTQIEKRSYIFNQIFSTKSFTIELDAIELSKIEKPRKRISFVPVSISAKEKISKLDKIALVIRSAIAAESKSITISYGKIFYGSKLKSIKIKLKQPPKLFTIPYIPKIEKPLS